VIGTRDTSIELEKIPGCWPKLKAVSKARSFWIVVVMMVASAAFHYMTPETGFPFLTSLPLTRHAVIRIIFMLPIVGAAYAFGRTGGIIALIVAVLIMLPRIFLISCCPPDSLVETVGVALVTYLVIWMIDVQERERKLRQKACEDLETLNAIITALTQSLKLDEILRQALEKVLEVIRHLEARGAVFLLDTHGKKLFLRAHQGLSDDLVPEECVIDLGECICGRVAQTGEVLFVRNALDDPRHTRCLVSEPHSHICVPLMFRDRMLGVLDLYLLGSHPPDPVDLKLLASVGRQVGIAVENARLYENLRFYVRQTTRAQENERKRIARELHDDTTQRLIDLSRRIDDLAISGDVLAESALVRLEEFQKLIDDMLRGIRRFSRDLRPSVLDDLGLLPALEGLMADLRENGIAAELQTRGKSRRLSPEVELALFRIVQEAYNNVKRHAGASRVVTRAHFDENRVSVRVQDDGHGFDRPVRIGDLAATGKLGLVGMLERAQLLDGTLVVDSALGGGTVVTVEIPA
jgi:signal transduction histidine kinase